MHSTQYFFSARVRVREPEGERVIPPIVQRKRADGAKGGGYHPSENPASLSAVCIAFIDPHLTGLSEAFCGRFPLCSHLCRQQPNVRPAPAVACLRGFLRASLRIQA